MKGFKKGKNEECSTLLRKIARGRTVVLLNSRGNKTAITSLSGEVLESRNPTILTNEGEIG